MHNSAKKVSPIDIYQQFSETLTTGGGLSFFSFYVQF